MFEAYVMLRSLELQLITEDHYDFVKFIFRIRELKNDFDEIGISSIIPVGSAANKNIRRDEYMIDIILSYNRNFVTQSRDYITGEIIQNSLEEQKLVFESIVLKFADIIKKEFC